MKLHDLAPADGAVKAPYRKAEASVPVTEKLRVRATKVRTHVPAAESDPALKAVRCPFQEDFPKEASPTIRSRWFTKPLMSAFSTSSRTARS